VALWATLALFPAACSGDDEAEPAAATTAAAAAATEAAQPTSTAGAEPAPATPEAEAEQEVEPEPVAPAVIAAAAAKTAARGSARVASTLRVSGPGDLRQSLGGEGAFDFERRTGRIEVGTDSPQGAPFSEATVVFVDTTAYYRLPPGALPGGKRWLQLDLQSLADASALDFGPLVQASQADPTQYLLWLGALGPEVTKAGETRVRGVPTTRYRAAVDLARLGEQAPRGRKDEWAAYGDTLRRRLGVETVPVEVWVDGDGLVRRLRLEYASEAEGTATAVTTELFDFGVSVNAQAPPPGQVASINDFIRP
jgi:hypothetical protein